MRRLLVVVVVALAVGVLAASAEVERSAGTRSGSGVESLASGGAAGAVFWTRGEIGQLAVDGSRAAAVTGNLKNSCDRIVVWTAPGKKFVTFKTDANCPKGGVSWVSEVAIGAGRVAWIEASAGGNNQELYLNAAKVTGGPSKEIDEAYNGMGGMEDPAGSYVGQLFGAGALLAYNSWTQCSWRESDGEPTADCPVEGRVSDVRLHWLSSAGRLRAKSGSRSLHLLAVAGGRMALDSFWGDVSADSSLVTVRSGSGALLASLPGTHWGRVVVLSTTRLVIQHGRSLDVRNPVGGALLRTIPLGSAAELPLVGANSKLALLGGRDRLVLVRISDGKRVRLTVPSDRITPTLNETGLFYAYNVRATPAKGRIVFEPTAELLGRF